MIGNDWNQVEFEAVEDDGADVLRLLRRPRRVVQHADDVDAADVDLFGADQDPQVAQLLFDVDAGAQLLTAAPSAPSFIRSFVYSFIHSLNQHAIDYIDVNFNWFHDIKRLLNRLDRCNDNRSINLLTNRTSDNDQFIPRFTRRYSSLIE